MGTHNSETYNSITVYGKNLESQQVIMLLHTVARFLHSF